MKNNFELCPFSIPILGKWCQCQYAKLADRCSGKMSCTRFDDLKKSCVTLDEAFKINTRFILSVINTTEELTHAQLMKIRCGGLIGMQRILTKDSNNIINIRETIDKVISDYGSIEKFPFDKIVQDIKTFKHRK